MLQELPEEILYDILAHLPSAKDFRNLSLCCKPLNEFIKSDGWKIFVKNRFPSLVVSVPPTINYAEAAVGLTSLSRNWDRRAFIARDLPMLEDLGFIPERHARRRGRTQTMNFVPIIDSHEEIVGGDWKSRQELLVYGAGPKIVSRFTWKEVNDSHHRQRQWSHDEDRTRQRSRWGLYQQPDSLEGRDDITTLKIRRRSNAAIQVDGNRPSFSVLAGTASGDLSLLDISYKPYPNTQLVHERKQVLHTHNNSALRSATFFPSQRMILSASSDGTVNVFRPDLHDDTVEPCASLRNVHRGPLWTAQCLSEENIVLGTGPSSKPLHFYRLTPTGLIETSIARWGAEESDTADSVSCILPLKSQLAMNSSENLFLTGNYNGVIKLHDLRSSSSFEVEYSDPIDSSTVYSLANLGQERILAGGGRSTLLKVFDLRMLHGCNYNYRTANQLHNPQQPSGPANGRGWTVFLRSQSSDRMNTRLHYASNNGHRGHARAIRNGALASAHSAVHSISIPSPYSPTVYAGLEGRVVQIDVADCFEKFPDPMYGMPPMPSINAFPSIEEPMMKRHSLRKLWDVGHTVFPLAHIDHERPSQLQIQARIGTAPPSGEGTEIDAHWHVASREIP
jgi:F-box associated protein/WD40 domain-containing protein